jgi:hypothetical protein
MGKLTLTELLKKIISESIDLYKISDFDKLGVKYKITKYDTRGIEMHISSKNSNSVYEINVFTSYKYKGRLIPSINFGAYNEITKTTDLKTDIKSPSTPLILACTFGILRGWLDEYKIKMFHYKAMDAMRKRLYKLYLDKHFKDYILLEASENDFVYGKATD